MQEPDAAKTRCGMPSASSGSSSVSRRRSSRAPHPIRVAIRAAEEAEAGVRRDNRPPQAATDKEDFAIEFGKYLATAADGYMDAVQQWCRVKMKATT